MRCSACGTTESNTTSSALLLAAFLWLQAPLERFERIEPCMGTLFRVVVYAPTAASATAALDAAFARARALDAMLSDYRPDSELNRLSTRWSPTSPELFTLLVTARQLSRDTAGAFDITLAPLVRLWRDARATRRLPSPAELRRARRRSGWRRVHLDHARRLVRLSPGTQLDLGGIAKGFTAGEMLALLRARGLPHALVAASGDIVAGEAPPGSPGWRIKPDWTNQTLLIANAAVSTSGDTHQWVEIQGERYSHIIDPRTGLGLRHSSPVTVIAPSGAEADALATAFSVLRRDKAASLLRRRPAVRALWP